MGGGSRHHCGDSPTYTSWPSRRRPLLSVGCSASSAPDPAARQTWEGPSLNLLIRTIWCEVGLISITFWKCHSRPPLFVVSKHMSDDGGLDLLGTGILVQAIPAKAWTQAVGTACDTCTSAIALFTATTSGIGRLITAKFDAEKVLATLTMSYPTEKATKSKKIPHGTAKASIVIAATESSTTEIDAVQRELWAKLFAQEFANETVHPEFQEFYPDSVHPR